MSQLVTVHAPTVDVAQNTSKASSSFTAKDYQTVQTDINQAFATFQTNYKAAEASFLSVANGGSPTVPGIGTAAQLHTYTTQQIGILVSSIQSAVSQVPGGTTGLLPSIKAQLTGKFAGNLQGALNTIPTNSGPEGLPDVLYPEVSTASINANQLAANNLLNGYWTGYVQGQTLAAHGQALATFNYSKVQGNLNASFTPLGSNFALGQMSFLSVASGGSPTYQNISTFAQLQSYSDTQLSLGLAKMQTAVSGVSGASTGLSPLFGVQASGEYTGSFAGGLSLIPTTTGPNGAPGELFSQVTTDLFNATQLAANNMLSAYNYGAILGHGATSARA